MKQRAEDQERTREKIIAATAALHGSVGPKNTTISGVAEKAGVQRLTVYRHFPTEESLFLACSSHWLDENPPPDPGDWEKVENVEQRTADALRAIYTYYGRTSSMWRLVYRDVDQVPAMQGPLDAFHEYLGAIRDDLVAHWQPRGRKSKLLVATVEHLLSFGTWDSLDGQKINLRQMVDLALRWITASQPASGEN
ncbi:MAG: TetR/AcrR family transcriptional regulator [Gammaproteobacteria bacterium]